jgi:putative ABC transport system substrate-binding protein
MRRREFITLLGGVAGAWPVAARAQQPVIPVVGVLYGTSAAEWTRRMASFRQGLAEVGFVEGRNVAVEYRWADGQLDRMGWMAAELISRQVTVILVGGNTPATKALLAANQTIPIVFTSGVDPVAAGLVASLSRPGGNATGITLVGGELGPKRVELLHEAVPAAKRIAIIVNQNNRVMTEDDILGAQMAAQRLGLEIITLNGGSEYEVEEAFAAAARQGVSAVIVGAEANLASRRKQIAALGLRHKLPTVSTGREQVEAGYLIGYGPDAPEMYRQAGIYVGRIIKGEKPANLPVLQPTKFELVINLKTARAIGIAIPPTLLARADEVIE